MSSLSLSFSRRRVFRNGDTKFTSNHYFKIYLNYWIKLWSNISYPLDDLPPRLHLFEASIVWVVSRHQLGLLRITRPLPINFIRRPTLIIRPYLYLLRLIVWQIFVFCRSWVSVKFMRSWSITYRCCIKLFLCFEWGFTWRSTRKCGLI